jgi:hypothetical protein
MVVPWSLLLWNRASSPSKTEKPAPAMKMPNAASSDQK